MAVALAGRGGLVTGEPVARFPAATACRRAPARRPTGPGSSVARFPAATALRRGLLPAAIVAVTLAGCRIDARPAVGDADDPTDGAALATGVHAVPRGAADAPSSDPGIVYHVVKGARFFDILVARIGNREHVVLGEVDDMCLDLPDQRDFDSDGNRDALVFQSPRCRGDTAPGVLFFVSADTAFRRSNPFPGHRPRIEEWNGEWSVFASGARHVLRDGRAVRVDGIDSAEPGGRALARPRR